MFPSRRKQASSTRARDLTIIITRTELQQWEMIWILTLVRVISFYQQSRSVSRSAWFSRASIIRVIIASINSRISWEPFVQNGYEITHFGGVGSFFRKSWRTIHAIIVSFGVVVAWVGCRGNGVRGRKAGTAGGQCSPEVMSHGQVGRSTRTADAQRHGHYR